MGRQARFRDVLAVGEFRALWAAELLSVAGDQLARVALAVLVYQRTSSAGLTALTYAMTLVPAMLGSALLSGLADRYPRRELMVAVGLFQAVVAGAMALPFVPLPGLIALVFLLTLATGPFKAAQLPLLRTVLSGEHYVTGLALRQVTSQSAQLAGVAGGGLLLTIVHPYTALGVNAATFLVSAVVVALGVRPRPAARRGTEDEPGVGGTLRYLWRDRTLRGLVAVSWLVGLFVVPEGLAAPYAAGLGASAAAVGLLMAGDPLGAVVGAWLLARVPERLRPRLLRPLAIASGLPLAVCIARPGLVASIVLWAVSGACSTVYVILAQAAFIERVPDHRRGAASGLASTGMLSAQGLAIFGAGVVADATSPALTIASAGAVGAILAGVIGLSWLGAARASRNQALTKQGPDDADEAMTDDELTSPLQQPRSAPPPVGHAAEHGTGGADSVIIARGPDRQPTANAGASRLPWRWAFWRVPKRVMIFILTVELLAGVLTVVLARNHPADTAALIIAVIIAGFGIAMSEASRHVERIRRRYADTPHVNMTSVWVVPAAILLPPVLMAAVVIALYLHLYTRSWYRVNGVHAYRLSFSATVAVLGCYTTWAVFHRLAPLGFAERDHLWTIGAVALALVAFSVVNSGLIGVAICLFQGRIDLHRAFGTAQETALEYGTLGLGAIAALLISIHPVWVLVMIPALLVLHRSVLIRQLEEAAATDPKTGLTNASAWTNIATREVQRASAHDGALGVLMVDIDHFKSINDTHGHVVGDQVIRAVADTLEKAVRRDDLVGRWGGEEFVVLCPDISIDELTGIGERICERIRDLELPVSTPGHNAIIRRLTVSVGAARFPDFGPELSDVVLAADDALFVAKDQGRNQVQSIVPAGEWAPGDETSRR